jgi:hypothetical protein
MIARRGRLSLGSGSVVRALSVQLTDGELQSATDVRKDLSRPWIRIATS